MKLIIDEKQLPSHYVHWLERQVGYRYLTAKKGLEASFVRALAPGGYPRFHIYVQETAAGLVLNLHLDQKQAVYENISAHSGEHDSLAVEQEIARIKSFL